VHQYNPGFSRAYTHTRAPTNSMYPKPLMTQASPAKSPGLAPGRTAGPAAKTANDPAPRGRRIQVKRSGVHGKGVFAVAPIAKGETIIEYRGELIEWPEALRRHPHDPTDPFHTFYFSIGETHVLDGKVGGNASRWINHACEPNCEADETEDGRVFIKALRALKPGTELFYDYGLVIDERHTAKLKKQYECRCGSKRCRGTMLAPKR